MKFYTFEAFERPRLGLEFNDHLIDLCAAFQAFQEVKGQGPLPALPRNLLSFIRIGDKAVEAAQATLGFLKRRPALPVGEQIFYTFEEVKILPPLLRPGKILCVNGEGSVFPKFASTILTSALVGSGKEIPQKPGLVVTPRHAYVLGPNATIFGSATLLDIRVAGHEQDILLGNQDGFCPFSRAVMIPCGVSANDKAVFDKITQTISLDAGDIIALPAAS